ncbi:MAG: hypothetical protein ACFB16_02515 [Phormidesmis sp.]
MQQSLSKRDTSIATALQLLVKEHYAISLIFVLATGLYLFQLGENSLWLDEFNSIHDAQQLPAGLEPTRPLYFILLRFWMIFGSSVEWLRGLSAVFALGNLLLLYGLGRRVANKAVGSIAALLLACSPLFINHVQEVRMYSLGNFLSILGSLFLLDALQQPTKVNIGKWAVSRILTTLTIPLGILLLAPDTLIVGWKFRRRFSILGKFVIAFVLIGLCLLPSSLSMVTSAGPSFVSGWTAELPKPGLAAVVSKLTSFTVFWPLASLPSNLFVKLLYYSYTLIAAAAVFVALLKLKTKRAQAIVQIAAWALLPAAIMLLFSHTLSPIWNSRYLLFLSPYFLILMAVGFTQVQQQSPKIAVLVVLIYLLAVGGGLNQYYAHWERDDWKAAIESVMAGEQPGDEIAVYAPMSAPTLAIDYYYRGPAPTTHTIGPLGGSLEKSTISEALSAIPDSSKRLWLVLRGFNGNPKANQLMKQAISEQFNVQSHSKFNGPVDVFLVTTKLENGTN